MVKRRVVVAAIAVSCILVLSFAGTVGLYALRIVANNRSFMTHCQSNLRQMGLAVALYQEDHGDRLPERVEDLYPKYVSQPLVFTCPRRSALRGIRQAGLPFAPEDKPSGESYRDREDENVLRGDLVDYRFAVSAGNARSDVLVEETESNHATGWSHRLAVRHVLRNDGTVRPVEVGGASDDRAR